MLVLLSPAKNLDFDAARPDVETTKPALSAETAKLVAVAKDQSRADLSRLMGISDKLADLNYERFQAFRARGKPASEKAAALAFNGDVYQGLEAGTLSDADLQYAQDRLRILSGLYGALRPLDAIQPYRLEMGTKLKTERGGDLYAFWGDRIAKELNTVLKANGGDTIVNLASNEYFKSVDRVALKARVITPAFKDEKDGKLRSLMYYAKRARGAMARWIIENRIEDAASLTNYRGDGYVYDKSLSSDEDWVFTRAQPAPKAA
ncbi:MAG: peroxide stress protein YaaA [Pseudomonadota bacterium]